MEDSGAISTVEHEGMTITSVGVSEADVKAGLESATSDEPKGDEKPEKPKSPKERASDAARELGKRGGKAAAARRAEAANAPPAPEKGATTETPREGDEAEGEEGPDDAPLPKRAQRRVEQATRQAAEHRRQLEAERQERARLEARLAALEVAREGKGAEGRQQPGERPPQRPAHEKPREEDFERYSDYLDARDEWNDRERDRRQQREQYAHGEVERYKHYTDRFVAALKPVMDDVSDELLGMRPYYMMEDHHGPVRADNLIAAELAFLAEKGPAVMRHLTDNPEELRRLRSLGTDHPSIRVEIQVLARTIGSQADATTGDPPAPGERASKPAQSRAHPPVRPVSGSAPVATGEGVRDGEDFDSYIRRTGKR